MVDIMDWKQCEEQFIRRVEIDPAKIDSLLETSRQRLQLFKSIKADNNNASFIVENYYEAIKELLIGLLLSKGLRSKNHQCLISYFYKNYPQYEAEANFIAQLSFLRNRLNYYGELIELDFYKKNKNLFEHIIKIIRGLVTNKR